MEKIKFGLQLPLHPMDLILRVAAYADKANFDSLFTPDHLVGIGIKRWDAFEAWSVLTACAFVTKRVTLGTCVSDVYRHHPAVLAQHLMTLDVISKGRAILGLGAGEAMNLNPYGISWDKPALKMRESILIVQMLLSQEKVDFEGKYFKLKNAFIMPKPVQKPHPPIYIAGNSKQTIKLTAELGNGWIPMGLSPESYSEVLRKIKSIAKATGREVEKIDPCMFLYIVVHEDYEEAKQIADLPAKMLFLLSPKKKEFLESIGYRIEIPNVGDLFSFEFNKENVERMKSAAREIPFEILEKRYLIGTPEMCIKRIEEYIKAGCRHVILTPLVSRKQYCDMLELISREVVGYFKR
ncbi:MAG: LLM class flavin-dependent oxidoreductase [Methanocellales archaeon]